MNEQLHFMAMMAFLIAMIATAEVIDRLGGRTRNKRKEQQRTEEQ